MYADITTALTAVSAIVTSLAVFLAALGAFLISVRKFLGPKLDELAKNQEATDVKLDNVKEHVDGRFTALEEKVDRKIERGLMLEQKLTDAGIEFEPDRTDITNGGTD